MLVSENFISKFVRTVLWGTFFLAATLTFAQNYYGTQYNSAPPAEDITVGDMLAAQNPAQNSIQNPAQNPVQNPTESMGEVRGPNVIPTRYDVPARAASGNVPAVSRADWQGAENTYGVVPASGNEPVSTPASVPVSAPASVPASAQVSAPAPISAASAASSPEPAALPEDYPSGTMAPLNAQNLIAFSETVTLPEGVFQQLTIIDPIQKVFCVYHVNMASGQIELKSARKIEWDLQLIYLNSKKPLPQEVQAILKQNMKRR